MRSKANLFIILFSLMLITLSASDSKITPEQRAMAEQYLKHYAKDIDFSPNNGQFDDKILFSTRTPQADIRFMEDRINFGVHGFEKDGTTYTWEMILDGIQEAVIKGKDKKKSVLNYYKGSQQVSDISNFSELWYESVYENIDLRFYSKGDGTVEYDYIVYPKGKVDDIQFHFEGIDNYRINEQGELVMDTPLGELKKGKPYTYQIIDGEEIEICSEYYSVEKGKISFRFLEGYDENSILYIDPTVIEWSTYIGIISPEGKQNILFEDGFFYIQAGAQSTTPITLGSGYNGSGQRDAVIMKFDTDGQLVFSTIIGGAGSEGYLPSGSDNNKMVYENGKLYIGYDYRKDDVATYNDYPVTSDAFSTEGSVVYSILDTDGSLLYSTYIGFDNEEEAILSEFEVMNGELTIVMNQVVAPTSYITTADSYQQDYNGEEDIYIIKFDASNQYVYSTFLGGSEGDYLPQGPPAGKGFNNLVVDENGFAYIILRTWSADFPVTANAVQNIYGGNLDMALVKIDPLGNVIYSTFLGGWDYEEYYDTPVVSNGDCYVWCMTRSDNINPVNAFQPNPGGDRDMVLWKVNADGSAGFTTYIGGSDREASSYAYGTDDLIVENNEVFLVGRTTSYDFPVTADAYQSSYHGGEDMFILKLDTDGNLLYSTYLGTEMNDGVADNNINHFDAFQLKNGKLYFTNVSYSTNLNTTDNALLSKEDLDLDAGNFSYIAVFNTADMSPHFISYLAGSGSQANHLIVTDEGKMITTGTASTDNPEIKMPISADALQKDPYEETLDHFILVINDDGSLCYGTYIGSSNSEYVGQNYMKLFHDNGDIYLYQTYSTGDDYPTTQGAFQNIRTNDFGFSMFTKFTTILAFNSTPNTITPITQTVCNAGDVGVLDGSDVEYLDLPIILRNGEEDLSTSPVFYQWQVSQDGGTTWEDVPGATTRDFKPSPIQTDTKFRRIIPGACGSLDIISNEVDVLVNGNSAPVADGGGEHNTCPNTPTQIGLPATGGTPPYTYDWFPTIGLDDPTLAQPTVTYDVDGIYDVVVTDANGCTHQDQAVVRYIQADAGPDKSACGGTGIRIGTPAVPGVGTYSWEPVDGLSNSNIAQPIATPSATTSYILTLTLDNGCFTKDTVVVTPVNLVIDVSDVSVCHGSSVVLGGPGTTSTGVTYKWENTEGLTGWNTAMPTFSADMLMEVQDTVKKIITITHTGTGCKLSKTVNIFVNNPKAGSHLCDMEGPIGSPDRSNGDAIYSWSVIIGDGLDPSDQNLPQPYVTPTVESTYELEVTWQGVTCTDQIIVRPCGMTLGGACSIEAPCLVAIPGVSKIYSSIDTANYNIVWSPASAVSDPNAPVVTTNFLASDTNIGYTATNKNDPSDVCSESITMLATTALSQATAIDGFICEGNSIEIGIVDDADHIYSWTGINGGPPSNLSDPGISNPLASPTVTTEYIILKTNIATGCVTEDTAQVIVRNPIVDAGPDRDFCENAIIELGTPAVPDQTYQWEPSLALFPSDIAQPIDTLFISTYYIVTTTDLLTGCQAKDTVYYNLLPAPVADAGSDFEICDGGATIIGPASTDPSFTYLWVPAIGLDNPNIPNPIAAPQVTTEYTLYVNGVIGCYDTDVMTVTVSICPPPLADAGPDQTICNNGSVQIGTPDASGGLNTYLWSPSTDLDDPTLAQPTVTTTEPSITYTLLVTEPGGTSNTDQVTITTIPPHPTEELVKYSCSNTDIQIGFEHGSGYTYSWNPGTHLNNTTIGNPTFNGTAGTYIYDVTITPPNGCPHPGLVTVNIVDVIADAGADQTVCGNVGVQIGDASMPNAGWPWTYIWSPSSSLDDNQIKQPIATPSETTTYTVTLTNGQNGCTSTSSVTVSPSVTLNTSTSTGGGNKTICVGESITIGGPDPSAGAWTYNWSVLSGDAASLVTPSVPQPSVNPTVTTIYQVEVSDGISCTRTGSLTVTVDEFSVDLGNDIVVCNGACVSIGISGSGSKVYQWSPLDGLSDPNVSNPIICATATNTYTLLVTDLITGCMATDDIMVSVYDSPPPVADAGTDAAHCYGDIVTLGTPSLGSDYSYEWFPTTNMDNPYLAQPTISMGWNGITYNVTVTNNLTGCYNVDQVSLGICDISLPYLTDQTICSGGSVQIGDDPEPGHLYSWTPTIGLSNPNISNPIASPSATITYIVQVTELASGYSENVQQTVNVLSSISPTVNAGDDITVCVGESYILGEEDPGLGYTYTWSPNTDMAPAGTASQVTVTPSSSFATERTYTLTADDGTCTSSDQVIVSIKDEAVYTIGNNKILCGDTETDLTATISLGHGVWSTVSGPNTPTISSTGLPNTQVTNLIPGIYKFRWTVSGSEPCNVGDYAEMTVEVQEAPILVINTPNAVDCFGGVNLTAPTITSGSVLYGATLSYWLDNLATVPVPDPTFASGNGSTFYIKAKTDSGCEVIQPLTIPSNCRTLPVEMLYFKAIGNCPISLIWATATEENNDYFDIERSEDGFSFEKIAQIQGAGNSVEEIVYHYKDVRLMEGRYYYRLKQVDFDGKFEYSDVITVKSNCEDLIKGKVFPNPTRGKFNYRLVNNGNGSTEVDIRLMNATGILILEKNGIEVSEGENTIRIEGEDLPYGMYFMEVLSHKGLLIDMHRIIFVKK